MGVGLHLGQMPMIGTSVLADYSQVARGWRRTTRARGGYWLGSFALTEEDLSRAELTDFYNTKLGCEWMEKTFGLKSWEGLLYEFRLVRDGREYRRTLDPEWWHNKVRVIYSYPTAEDSEQGNLTYNPVANSFQDDGQDFSEWETLAGAAVYAVAVENDDGTRAWGFMGASFTSTNANDSIYVYVDVEMVTAGWNGETSEKTPSTYTVSDVVLSGARQDTGWDENTDSSDKYGEMEYVVSLAGTAPEAAEAMRGRELTAYGWPRSRKVGGGSARGGEGRRWEADVLEVSVAGFWVTLNWRYRTSSYTATARRMIELLVGASEFVTAGRVEENELRVKVEADPIPQRLGDLVEGIILQGDEGENVWQGGVFEGREFVYEQAPTVAYYYEREDGVLVDRAGMEVVPSLVKPGFLLLDTRAPDVGRPAGTSSAWDDPRVGYVEEVEFVAPDGLNYRLLDEEAGVAVGAAQARGFVPAHMMPQELRSNL